MLGGAPLKLGWKICPCSTSPSQLAPCRTRPSSNRCNNNKSNNNNSVGRRRPAGWRTTAQAVPMVAASYCRCTTNRTMRTERTAWPSRPAPKLGAFNVVPISSPTNSLNFARNYYIHFFSLHSFPSFLVSHCSTLSYTFGLSSWWLKQLAPPAKKPRKT